MGKKTRAYTEEYVKINGQEQYLLAYPAEEELPVALFLHGGPGSSEADIAYLFADTWSTLFTVVHWDQRGAGKTLARNPKAKKPTVQQLLHDTYQVVQHLKEKYNKEKILIIGHSWGTVLGTLFIKEYPEEVLAYIGAGQVIDMQENERTGYEALKKSILRAGNQKDIKALGAIGTYPLKEFNKDMERKIMKVRKLQQKYKLAAGATPKLIMYYLKSPAFRFCDITSMIKAADSNTEVMDFLMTYSLYHLGRNYDVPIFYLLGDRDYQTPYKIAEKYFDTINAPCKEKFILKGAGHMSMLDTPDSFYQALQTVMTML
ncbi:MAG: alpha/beta hydrolase [Lachnospiraceae bacterium]|nr:alpha/beta hydrolase [Lachnospiraceae bacterium]